MEKKNITGFICSLSSGGAERQLTELCNQLAERGYNVTIVTFADITDHYKCSANITRKRLGENRNFLIKFISIFCFFIRLKTDIVICFGQRESALCLLPLIFRRKIKVINGERNLTLGRSSLIEKFLLKILYRRSNHIVSNSFSQKEHLIRLAPYLSEKISTIINYLDTDYYTPTLSRNSNQVIRIGIFCRYAPQKNCERFAKAIKIIKDEGYNVIVDWYGNKSSKGNRPNEYFLYFENLVNQLGINDLLHLKDHVKNVKDLMITYDAICVPSLWEGFSNTIAEAIACGLPMLVSNVSDNSVMVEDGINGYVFNPKSVAEISKSIKSLVSSSAEQREIMGKKSRKRALDLFSTGNFINSYIKLIND